MLEDKREATLRVVEVDPQRDARWSAWLARQPAALIYHHPVWLQVLADAFGYQPAHLACEDATTGQVCGVLPLLHMHGLITGRRYSSLPRTPLAGPLARDAQARAALVQAAVSRVRREPHAQLQLKLATPSLDGLVAGLVGVAFRMTYVLELPERVEALHLGDAHHQTSIKRAVNKAARHGVQVRAAERESELRAWYGLYAETMRWHAVPPRPYRFFEIAWNYMQPRGQMRLLLAEQRTAARPRLLAGALYFMSGATVSYAFGGRRQEELALRPNDAIHWQAIHDACAAGFRHYDFGEVGSDNPGLAAFKQKWGTVATPLYRYYYPAPREVEIGLLESQRRPQQLVKAAWRHMPLPLTTLLGDAAHRYF